MKRHGHTILNRSINVLTEYGPQKMPHAQVLLGTGKKILYVIFLFDNKGPVMQLPAPKGRAVTDASYKNVVLKILTAHFKRCRRKTGFKHLHLLHDNAAAEKARIVTEFLESEKVNVLQNPPFSLDLAPCDYFLFPKLRFHLSGKNIRQDISLGFALYQFFMGVPIQDYERCFHNWINRLKRCMSAGGEFIEGQRKVN